MEEEARIEGCRPGVGKITRFVGRHSYENLHQTEQPREYALMSVLFDLAGCLAYGNAAALEFDMDDRHSVDKQAQIPSAIVLNLVFCGIDRLLRYLIAALTCGNFMAVIDFEADFLA